jgi:hypothetical protein
MTAFANTERGWPAHPAGRIALLDVDPDLAGHASPAEIRAQSRHIRASLRREVPR